MATKARIDKRRKEKRGGMSVKENARFLMDDFRYRRGIVPKVRNLQQQARTASTGRNLITIDLTER